VCKYVSYRYVRPTSIFTSRKCKLQLQQAAEPDLLVEVEAEAARRTNKGVSPKEVVGRLSQHKQKMVNAAVTKGSFEFCYVRNVRHEDNLESRFDGIRASCRMVRSSDVVNSMGALQALIATPGGSKLARQVSLGFVNGVRLAADYRHSFYPLRQTVAATIGAYGDAIPNLSPKAIDVWWVVVVFVLCVQCYTQNTQYCFVFYVGP
jgi:hypothetical protein